MYAGTYRRGTTVKSQDEKSQVKIKRETRPTSVAGKRDAFGGDTAATPLSGGPPLYAARIRNYYYFYVAVADRRAANNDVVPVPPRGPAVSPRSDARSMTVRAVDDDNALGRCRRTVPRRDVASRRRPVRSVKVADVRSSRPPRALRCKVSSLKPARPIRVPPTTVPFWHAAALGFRLSSKVVTRIFSFSGGFFKRSPPAAGACRWFLSQRGE